MAVLHPSLITSYVTGGALTSERSFNIRKLKPYMAEHYNVERPIGAEVYLFMEPDALHWHQRLRQQPAQQFASAVQFLASLTATEIRNVAEEIVLTLDAIGVEPMAIASFIPEIAAPEGSSACELAQKSIASLLRFAVALRGSRNRLPIVELVVGSTIERIVESTNADGGLHIRTVSDDVGCRRVLSTLRRSFELGRSDELYGDAINDVRVALELEPGPLYLLRDQPTLRIFADSIAATENTEISANVGFNLDIAHWCLAGIGPAWLKQSENSDILSRIFHAHISGHSTKGHFGDISLGYVDGNQKDELAAWLSFLGSLAEDRATYSGAVSVEYEAARDEVTVIESVREFLSWL